MKQNKKRMWLVASAVVVTAAIYGFMIAFGLPCPIKYVTGVSCAGCGMTRAITCVLGGEIALAFTYHPLWIVLPIWLAALLATHFCKKNKLYDACLWSGAVLFLAVWILRLVDQSCTVVSFDLDEGLIGRLICGILP